MKINVRFAQIGRHRYEPPLTESFQALDYDALANRIATFARKRMASRGVDVEIRSNGTGALYAGDRPAGAFTWSEG